MKTVIDANVLFRTLISTGEILDIFYDSNLEIYAPIRLREEFLKHKDEILDKSNFTDNEFQKLSEVIFGRITFIEIEKYLGFLPKAREILKEHEKDEDFVALALSLNCKVWTYEDLLFKIGIAISTKEISNSLREI